MIIRTMDGKQVVNIGSSDIWHSVYSTIVGNAGRKAKLFDLALKLFEEGGCNYKEAIDTARQFNLIRDFLSQIDPQKAIYDINDKKKNAPWKNKMSPIITSCGNMFITADGKDLLSEVVGILTYAYYAETEVTIE